MKRHLQVIGPLKVDELFTQEDFNLLEKYTMKTSAEKIKSKVKTMKLEDRQYVSSDAYKFSSAHILQQTRKMFSYF